MLSLGDDYILTVAINGTIINFSGLMLIFISVFLLVISIFLLQKKHQQSNKSEKNNIFDWVDRKDLIYWIIIVCLGSISVFTFQYSGDKTAIAHWGFAGTIVSIILAVIAIVFTFYQSFYSNVTSDKIFIAADKITKATDELDTQKLIKSSDIINDVAENLTEMRELLHHEIRSLRNENKKGMDDLIKKLSNNLMVNNPKEAIVDNYTLDEEGFTKLFFRLPERAQIFLYFIYKIATQIPPFNTDKMGNMVDIYTLKEIYKTEKADGENLLEYGKGFYSGANFAVSWDLISALTLFGAYFTEANDFEIPQEILDAMEKVSPYIVSNYEEDHALLEQYINNQKK